MIDRGETAYIRNGEREYFTQRWAGTVKERPERFQAEYDADGYIVAVCDADSGYLYLAEGWVA